MLNSETTAPISLGEIQFRSVSSFLVNLHLLVSDASSDHIVRWSAEDNTFLVIDQEMFTDQVLPQYLRHTNFTSFVRMLNLYEFKKTLTRKGHMKAFYHPSFQMDRKDLLSHIKRRTRKSKTKKVQGMLGNKRVAPDDPGDKDSFGIMLSSSDGAKSALGDLECQKIKGRPRIEMVISHQRI